MQMVILAGGLGTRLRPLTHALPKVLIPVDGKPFLHHQIELLKEHGIRDIVLCVGHLADQIRAYFGEGDRLGVRIRYSEERGMLLGTAGALKNAEPLLEDGFFLLYGDSYLLVDYGEVMRYFRRPSLREGLGLMVVYHNADRYERSNVIVRDGRVAVYDKEGRTPGMEYINYGLSVLRKEALSLVPAGRPFSQEELYRRLIERGELLAWETKHRFYEIGSRQGLAEFRELVASGRLEAIGKAGQDRSLKGAGSLLDPCGLKPAATVKAAGFNPRGG
jgi:NDP-sugar pyrophosphorylase family protein